MSARTTVQAWRRGWWVLALGVVVGVLAGLLAAHSVTGPRNVSSAQVLVSPGVQPSMSSTYETNQYVNQRSATYAEFVTSDDVLRAAGRDLGIAQADLAPEVSATVIDRTTVILIRVRGTSPANARRAAQAVTDSFLRAVVALETPVPGQAPRVAVGVIGVPTTPPTVSFVPAGIGGGAAGAVLALVGLTIHASPRVRRTTHRVRRWMSAEGAPEAGPHIGSSDEVDHGGDHGRQSVGERVHPEPRSAPVGRPRRGVGGAGASGPAAQGAG